MERVCRGCDKSDGIGGNRMKVQEYLSTVTEQIRCKQAREMVSEELREHILDQAKAYEEEGMFEEEALERAVKEMGDPVETGVALDGIHRPKLSVGLLILIGMISLCSIAVHGMLGMYTQEVSGAGYWYLKHHIFYLFLGYLMMFLVYRLDYSILARHARKAAIIFFVLVCLGGTLFGIEINGAKLYLRLGAFYLFLPTVMSLYVPLYGGLLYSYRGEGYKGILKLLLWAVVPVWFTFRLPAFSQGMVLWCTLMVLLGVTIWKGWYSVRKKSALTLTGVLFTAPIWSVLGRALLGGFANYQTARIQAFLTNSPDGNYLTIRMREFLSGSKMLGSNAEQILELGKFPGFNSDYIFVSVISAYGIFAGILVAALLAYLLIKIFRVSFYQKNQLGMILGCGCGMVYLFQILLSIGMNLGLLPTTAAILPFFSSGGSGIVISYILLGLVLSVYRYQNILSDKPTPVKTLTFRFSLKI